jgi:phospholipid-binding lipoprotein MlaA
VHDGLGDVLDGWLYPTRRLDNVALRDSLAGLLATGARANALDAEPLIQGDRYTFFRDSDLQRRAYRVNDGEVADRFPDHGL